MENKDLKVKPNNSKKIETAAVKTVMKLAPNQEEVKPKVKTGKSSKKPAASGATEAPRNLEEFISMLVLKPNKSPETASITGSDQEIATELRNIFTNIDHKLSKLNLLESISIFNLKKITKATSNPNFILDVFMKFQGTSAGELALSRIIREYKKYPNFMNILEDNNKKASFQEGLLRIAESLKSNFEEHKDLRWWLIINTSEVNLPKFIKSPAWDTLKGKSDEFLSLSGLQISQLLRKLHRDRMHFIEFLVHIEIEKSAKSKLAPVQKMIDGVTSEDILAYIVSGKKVMSRMFLESLFLESLQNKLDSTRTIEDCLSYYLIEANYPNFFTGDRIKRSWKRVQITEAGLIEKFQNDDLNRLKNELEEKTDEISQKTLSLDEANSRLKANQLELEKNRNALLILEDRLRERVSDQSSGNNAIERQIRINQLRVVVEVLESEISSGSNSRIVPALEKIGIKRIGEPGEKINWDSLVCESITGVEIANPVVIKPGYTWSNDGDMSVLVKALVKPQA